MNNKQLKIKENSFVARMAAKKLRAHAVALVLGKTVHLHNISRQGFLTNKQLLRHELCHVRQYQRHGFIGFLILYLWESIRKGYYHNKFEVEARAAENDQTG